MTAKRLFIAIDISDEARGRAAEHIDQLRATAGNVRVGWEKTEKLHITLKFLGHIDESRITAIEESIRTVAKGQTHFTAELTGPGVFPNARKPRVLWLGVNDDGSIGQIAVELDRRLEKLGFEAEKRQFSPHLTVARIREPQKAKRLAEAHLQSRFEPVAFAVNELIVYESILKPTASVYSVVSRCEFQH